MAQKPIGGVEFEVDSQNRVVPTGTNVEPRTTVVTVTTAGLTLDELIAAARAEDDADQKKILPATRQVTLETHGNTITRTTGGAAPGANSTPIPTPGISFYGTQASLAGMRFYGADVAMSITEEG